MDERLSTRLHPVVKLGEHDSIGLPADPKWGPLDLLDCLGCAAVLVQENGKVLGTNARADSLLGADLILRAGRLVAIDRESNSLLQELVNTAVSGAFLTASILLPPIMVKRREGRPIVAQVLPSSGLTAPGPENAPAILLLTGLDAVPEVPESRLMLLFRLTPAEARLAVRLGTGETVEEAAEALKVSVGTARNQLKAVFAKTETNRQAELVALLWRVSDLAVSKALVPALLLFLNFPAVPASGFW